MEKSKKRPHWAWRLFKGLLIVGFLCAVAGAVVGGVLYYKYTTDEPLPDVVTVMEEPLAQATVYLDRKGQEIARGGAKRRVLTPEEIPGVIKLSALAAEDRRFFRHYGVDPLGVGRALLRGGKAGGSGITQQLAKRWVGNERSLRRKVRELALALAIERRYSKEQILARYLNSHDFGGEHFGVEEASWAYFGKPAAEVNLSEAALLAALLQKPTTYKNDLLLWKKRQRAILYSMVGNKWADKADADASAAMPIALAKRPPSGGVAPECIDAVNALLKNKGVSRASLGGSIQVTCDRDLEVVARAACQEAIRNIRPRRNDGKDPGQLQCAVVAMDIESGDVLVNIGRTGYKPGDANIATGGHRQTGSTFKTLALAAGLKLKLVTLTTSWYDVVKEINQGPGFPVWIPSNYDSEHFDGPVPLRLGLAHSVNTVYAQLMEAVKPRAVADMAKALGIQSKLRLDYSLVLGTSEVSLLELTNAYRVFANHGVWSPPRFILRVDGKSWDEVLAAAKAAPEPETRQAVSEALAYVVTSALKSVVEDGTGKGAKEALPGWGIAGKTGTTNDSKDVYFVAYTPKVVVGVWLGYDLPTMMMSRHSGKGATGGSTALPVWKKVARAAHQGQAPSGFGSAPYGVEVVGGEVYLAGTVPPNAPQPTLFPGATLPANLPPPAADGGSTSPDGGSAPPAQSGESPSVAPSTPEQPARRGATQDSDWE